MQLAFLATMALAQAEHAWVNIGGAGDRPLGAGVSALTAASRTFAQSEGVTRNGVPVFDETYKHAQVWDWPAYYLRQGYTMSITIPATGTIPKDGFVEFYCADNGPCDVGVFVYECYPCRNYNGGLPAYLAAFDPTLPPFTRTRCAPQFTLRKGGAKQRMTGYVTTVPANKYVIFRMPKEVRFALFGISDGQGNQCTDLNQARCINTAGHCLFRQRCEYATCTQRGPGGCNPSTCVDVEAELARR